MAYQFIHIESYARTASSQRKKDGHASTVRSVCAEANREEDACPHVDSPLAPELLHGAPLVDVEARAMEWGEQARDAMGRKLRKDAPVLLAGVFSAPDSLEDWEGFKAKAVDHLRSKYGSRLLSVLEHKDEAHRHCHFYAVPLNGERFEILHEGKRASLEAKADGQVKGEQNRAYKTAMRGLQDRFFEEVSAPFGLLRLGPGRRRLTRAAYKAEQDQGAALAKTKVWAEDEKRAAVALADQAKAEADRVRAEAAAEASAAIALASQRAKETMEEVGEVKAKALADTATATRYKRELRELRDETKEERDEAKKEHETAKAVRAETVKIRMKWTTFGGKLGAFWRGLKWSKAKPLREAHAKVSELEANLHEKSVLANELDHQMRKVKAENGIQLANDRAQKSRRDFEEARRFKPSTDPKDPSHKRPKEPNTP